MLSLAKKQYDAKLEKESKTIQDINFDRLSQNSSQSLSQLSNTPRAKIDIKMCN